MIAMESLVRVFAQVEDPRKPRGVRQPIESILALVFLGLLARIREMEKLNRWATEHWEQLREPLGFDREQPPHATTISRSLARCELSSFARAFQNWIQQQLPPDEAFVAAVEAGSSATLPRSMMFTASHFVPTATIRPHQPVKSTIKWYEGLFRQFP